MKFIKILTLVILCAPSIAEGATLGDPGQRAVPFGGEPETSSAPGKAPLRPADLFDPTTKPEQVGIGLVQPQSPAPVVTIDTFIRPQTDRQRLLRACLAAYAGHYFEEVGDVKFATLCTGERFPPFVGFVARISLFRSRKGYTAVPCFAVFTIPPQPGDLDVGRTLHDFPGFYRSVTSSMIDFFLGRGCVVSTEEKHLRRLISMTPEEAAHRLLLQ